MQQNTTIAVSERLNLIQKDVIAIMQKSNKAYSRGDIAKMFDLPLHQAYQVLANLREAGHIKRTGKGSSTRYASIELPKELEFDLSGEEVIGFSPEKDKEDPEIQRIREMPVDYSGHTKMIPYAPIDSMFAEVVLKVAESLDKGTTIEHISAQYGITEKMVRRISEHKEQHMSDAKKYLQNKQEQQRNVVRSTVWYPLAPIGVVHCSISDTGVIRNEVTKEIIPVEYISGQPVVRLPMDVKRILDTVRQYFALHQSYHQPYSFNTSVRPPQPDTPPTHHRYEPDYHKNVYGSFLQKKSK